jgi:hypothetical protein
VSRALAVELRAPLDAYCTPTALARAISERLRRVRPATVVEPSAGLGPFVAAARAVWPTARVTAVDVDPGTHDVLVTAGAHQVVTANWAAAARRADLIVGNPPYLHAEQHVRLALAQMHPGDQLAFLLRLNLLGSRGRVEFWRETPLAWVAPVIPRPSFTPDGGTDATEYALFVWRQGYRGAPQLRRPIIWR